MARGQPDLNLPVDHLVYAVPSLEPAVAELERRLGVRATPGGRHLGEGTWNAIIPLGPAVYLEILAPDPAQPPPDRPRWLGVDRLSAPRLTTWAAKGSDLDSLVSRARGLGIPLGAVRAGSRRRPDGVTLTWRLTDPHAQLADGVIPFFIDWGASPHPAGGASSPLALARLRAEHPDGDRIGAQLLQLGLDLDVTVAPAPALIATIRTPKGLVELR